MRGQAEVPDESSGQKVVAFGGGHGLSATLRALRHITHQITAVVTVADDGGSSGRIRQEKPVLPPGDLRMALVSLCEESKWGPTWRDLMHLRFDTTGPLDGHALGNLMIVGMWQMYDSPVQGLDWMGRLLNAHGRVLPMSLEPLRIEAQVLDEEGVSRTVQGQTSVATAHGRITNLRVRPEDAPVPPEAVGAIEQADWLVFGPGSWFTSVIPHLLVKELRRAIVTSAAHRALILNLIPESGETETLSAADLVRAFYESAPDLKLDVVVADPTAVEDVDDLVDACGLLGARLLLRQVRSGADSDVHDPLRLGSALRDAFEGFLGEVGQAEAWLS